MEKSLRCYLGIHSWEVKGRFLTCKLCGYNDSKEDGRVRAKYGEDDDGGT